MGMKALKTMKAPMKAQKAMKVSKVAKGKHARAVVFRGNKEKTGSGMTKDKLIKNKAGKIVSKARSALSKKRFATSPLKKWMDTVKQARKQLNVKGFCAVNGKSAQGKALYAKAKSIFGKGSVRFLFRVVWLCGQAT